VGQIGLGFYTTTAGGLREKGLHLVIKSFLLEAREDDRFYVIGDGWEGDVGNDPRVKLISRPHVGNHGHKHIEDILEERIMEGSHLGTLGDDDLFIPGRMEELRKLSGMYDVVFYKHLLHTGKVRPFQFKRHPIERLFCLFPNRPPFEKFRTNYSTDGYFWDRFKRRKNVTLMENPLIAFRYAWFSKHHWDFHGLDKICPWSEELVSYREKKGI